MTTVPPEVIWTTVIDGDDSNDPPTAFHYAKWEDIQKYKKLNMLPKHDITGDLYLPLMPNIYRSKIMAEEFTKHYINQVFQAIGPTHEAWECNIHVGNSGVPAITLRIYKI